MWRERIPSALVNMRPSTRPSGRTGFVVAVAWVVSACHVTTRFEETRQGEIRHEVAPDAVPRALPPSMDVSEDGRFRFVTPFVCATQSVTDMAVFDVERRRPNVATLVVGVIAASLSAVATVSALSDDDPGGSPLAYVGPAGLAVGLPLAIGPMIGNSISRVPKDVKELRAPAGEEPCGTKPLPGRHATIAWSGLRVAGAIDADGYFAVSPFAFIDAFDVGQSPALVLQIEIEQESGTMPMEVVLDAAALAGARDGYFKRIGIDATIEELRKVPRLEASGLRVSRVRRDAERGVRIALTIANNGPGDAYGVRLSVNTPSGELDGRFIYVGRLPAKTTQAIDTVIPISEAGERALSADDLELAVIVRDAHATASDAPLRFRGRVLPDPSR